MRIGSLLHYVAIYLQLYEVIVGDEDEEREDGPEDQHKQTGGVQLAHRQVFWDILKSGQCILA